ncbi:hypothetical protein BCV69DRAFT_280704 [Microstroma glucosiphilum]|uniref:EF-hand domain-containing protein n=1 Tax=Pseudomicrostroma glucosiphilum TaxID=1684307 RepID=A0A316UFA1_9BASI|nr:hypothetical protein BCV69DRAFT_280704 [Pseudomicrostroma glucosiphilum]PWN23091.1 hypothetical protein BCV69DRAFT_280704 [Pseudomicrostroma glucosiphilum]
MTSRPGPAGERDQDHERNDGRSHVYGAAGSAVPSRLASPPYEIDGSLPLYASRPDLFLPLTAAEQQQQQQSLDEKDGSAGSGSGSSSSPRPAARLAEYDGYPAEKKLREREEQQSDRQDRRCDDRRGGETVNRQGSSASAYQTVPRIAITDPLHEMRVHNLSSRPEQGLSERSDYPSKERMMASKGVTEGDISPRPGLSRQASSASLSSQSEFGYDDFDWSDDEGVEESLRQEQKEVNAARKQRNRRLSPYKVLRWLFASFLGNFLVSCTLVVPCIVMEITYRNEGPDADKSHRAYVTDNVSAWTIWASVNLFLSWILHILVELLPRAALGVVALVWGRTNQVVLTAAEYYSAQKGYFKPILYAACAWASFAIIFNSIFNLYNRTNPQTESRALYLYRLYEVVEFLFFFTLTICVEKIIVKNIALGFHKSAFAERIAEVTQALETFDHLKDYRPKLKDSGTSSPVRGFRSRTPRPSSVYGMSHEDPSRSRSFAGVNAEYSTESQPPSAGPIEPQDLDTSLDSRTSSGGFFKIRHAKKRAQNTDPAMTGEPKSAAGATYPPHAPNAGEAHSRSSTVKSKKTVFGAARGKAMRSFKINASVASKLARVAMKDPLAVLQSDEVGAIANVNSPAQAKKLAKTIFTAFRGRHRRSYLILSDFEPAYSTQAEAKTAFAVFDKDGNGDISQAEIKNVVLQTYKERRFLMKAIGDTNHAVSQLDTILLVLALVVVLFEAFAIFNVDVTQTLTTFYTLGIAFAFIFKESAQNVFDSIIFIFVTHAMDTGDRICVGESVMVVTKMSLLSSEFTLADGTDLYISNATLSALMIRNYRRSGYQWENFLIQVDIGTTLEQLDAVERDMCHWLQTEPDRLFEPSTALVPQHISYMTYIEISVGMTHRANYQDWGARFQRKNAFGAALTYYLKKHGVRYYQPAQPIVYTQPPPGYNDDQHEGDDGQHRSSRFSSEEHEEETYFLDDFSAPAGATATSSALAPSAAGAGTSASSGVKRPNYMGFTPPDDEANEEKVRQRKVKNLALTNQGGDS